MEKELKTLKDFEFFEGKNPKAIQHLDAPRVTTLDLKQEAIKHIKELEHKAFLLSGTTNNVEKKICIFKQTDWIKYFFNITKED